MPIIFQNLDEYARRNSTWAYSHMIAYLVIDSINVPHDSCYIQVPQN